LTPLSPSILRSQTVRQIGSISTDLVATYGPKGQEKGNNKIYGKGRNTHRHQNQTFHFANEENFRAFTKSPNEYIQLAQRSLYTEAERKRGKTMAELYPNP
jgi:hypothetical protein